jgi:hypothetical protein
MKTVSTYGRTILAVLECIYLKTAACGQPRDALNEPYRKKQYEGMQAREIIPNLPGPSTIQTSGLVSVLDSGLIPGLVSILDEILFPDWILTFDRVPSPGSVSIPDFAQIFDGVLTFDWVPTAGSVPISDFGPILDTILDRVPIFDRSPLTSECYWQLSA